MTTHQDASSLILLLLSLRTTSALPKPSVLFAVFDDLRPQLGAYGHSEVSTPHLDALASSAGAMTFLRAYTNYAYCAPSRNSFMSGRMPGTSKVFNFIDSFREAAVKDRAGLAGTEWTSLPGHFTKHGYWSAGTGKLFHPNKPPDNDNAWGSWSLNATDPGGNAGCTCPTSGVVGAPMYCELANDVDCPDVAISHTVVDHLHGWKTQDPAFVAKADRGKPFFVGIGIHKPHLPWGAPKKFFDVYPNNGSDLPLATHKFVPTGGYPPVAYHHCQWGPFPWNSSKGHPVADATAHLARRGYFAAISFADSLLGLALDAVDAIGMRNSTIVVVMSDHGWLLGEHNEWCKESNFENALHVPLIFRIPQKKNSTQGTAAAVKCDFEADTDYLPASWSLGTAPAKDQAACCAACAGVPKCVLATLFMSTCYLKAAADVAGGRYAKPGVTSCRTVASGRQNSDAFVTNIDVYRTLSDLAGLPVPEAGVDGVSFAPLIRAPGSAAAMALVRRNFSAAFSQHARCLNNNTDDPFVVADACPSIPRTELDWMGYSIRVAEFRFTMWVKWNGALLTPDWSVVNATELYDWRKEVGGGASEQDFDAWENQNVADESWAIPVIANLSQALQDHFDRFAIPMRSAVVRST